MLEIKNIIAGVVVLVLVTVGSGCSSTATQRSAETESPGITIDRPQRDLVALRRNAVETAYPEFKDFENQESFAGHSVKSEVDDGEYYFAYMVLGSGLPIAEATCFRVDRAGRVFEIGLFPDLLDSYTGYRDVNPRDCKGIE